jgi:hypothetical protein
MVIPVSWSTVDDRNDKLYLHIAYDGDWYKVISIPSKNYTGPTFAEALGIAINEAVALLANMHIDVIYDQNDNQISIVHRDNFYVLVKMVSGADLQVGKNWSAPLPKDSIQSMNGILRLGKTSYLISEAAPYVSYLDLHTIRNLCLTISALANYTNSSNFDNDVIIKKSPINAAYGQMMFYNASAGSDVLDVSKRSLRRIDFRLQDSFGSVVDLRNNHWSFSMVFQVH